MKYILGIITAFFFLSLPLSGCGIKPKSVDAPQGQDTDQFPRQYPSH